MSIIYPKSQYQTDVFNVKDFGAIGNGTTDDTDAIKSAIDAMEAAGGGKVVFPGAATYLLSGSLAVADTDNWEIDLCGSTLKMEDGATADASHSIISIARCDNFEIRHGTMDGNLPNRTGAENPGHNCRLYDCEQFTFSNVVSKNSTCDGWYITSTDNQDPATFCKKGLFTNCIADANYRQGISIINGYDITFINCEFKNTDGTAPEAGVDIERNALIPAGTAEEFTADNATDTFTSASHTLSDGDAVRLTSTTALPDGLETDTTYYVISAAANTFQLAATWGGSAVEIDDDGTGTHTATPLSWGWVGCTPSNLAIRFYGCKFLDNDGNGLKIVDDADMVIVNGCYFNGNRCAVETAGYVHLEANQFVGSETNSDAMVDIDASSENRIGRGTKVIGNDFLGPCAGAGINIHGTHSYEPYVISNNMFFAYKNSLVAYAPVIFSNNVITRGDGLQVTLTNGSDNSLVQGNLFTDCQNSTHLLYIGAAHNQRISGNQFTNCVVDHLLRSYGSNHSFSNNTCIRNDNAGAVGRILGGTIDFKDNVVVGYLAEYANGPALQDGGYYAGHPMGEISTQKSTTNATEAVLLKLETQSNTCYHLESTVLATETDDYDEMATYKLAASYKNEHGSLSNIGPATVIHSNEDVNWACNFDTNGTDIYLNV